MAELSREELDEVHAFAIWLGKEAGKMLMSGARVRMEDERASTEEKDHVQKENAVDLVTETDESRPPQCDVHRLCFSVYEDIGELFVCSVCQ